MQNLRLIPGAVEMWDRLKASVWVRFHAFFSIYGLLTMLVDLFFFLIQVCFLSILLSKISIFLQTSTATLISLKTCVVGHTTRQRATRGLFSLQAPGWATLNQVPRLCLVRWLMSQWCREEGADGPFSLWTGWLIMHSYQELQRLCKAECFLLWKLSDALFYGFMTYL